LFSGGLVVGTNFSQVDGDRYAGYFKVGVNAGAVLYTRLSQSLAISMELLFSQKGSSSNYRQGFDSSHSTIVSQKINLNYAEIPVMLNLYDKRKSHLGAGLSYSQLISADEKVVISGRYTYDPDKYPFKKRDINLILGANLNLVKGLYANLRFQYSISPIRSIVDSELARSKQYNNLWTLRIMYIF
jgi:hypothetical protein